MLKPPEGELEILRKKAADLESRLAAQDIEISRHLDEKMMMKLALQHAEQQTLQAEQQKLQAEQQKLQAEQQKLQAEQQKLQAEQQKLQAEQQTLQAEERLKKKKRILIGLSNN
jgi:uncharacterized protein YlxW (UPF0749 family)